MKKYMFVLILGLPVSLVAGCTTEKHYPPPAPTIIHEERPSAAESRSDAREAAREGAREGARDAYR
ncbi:exported protein of unknown function [Nitrospira japonica]|uniref:Lipoprotein n=1 Tax=Nitrospira japonica TaxID=1325564 RepID=A0A1W1I789_9BACT|nr:hypothetical protein [Nitrospira japonica]SLM48864.1 exported protein of unknown function [Nitrospira japonica]